MSVWSWGDPLGLGAFVVAIGLTILVLSLAVHKLSTIPASEPKSRSNRSKK